MKTLLTLQVGLIAVALAGSLAMADDTKPKTPLIQQVFDLERSDREDVIYFRNKDVLRGEVLNQSLTVATQYGVLNVPLRRCAGLSFEGARANTEAIVTVNYNRITGIITDNVINFKIASSGTTIPIRKEKVRFVLLRKTPKELQFIEDTSKSDLFLMANGDLLTGEAKEREIRIRTDYATVPVSFKEMKDVTMQGGDNVTAIVSKTNGDTMRGTLDTDEVTLDLEIGVQVVAVYKDKLARVFVDRARREAPAQFGVQQPVLGESDGVVPAVSPAGGQKLTLDLGNGVKMELVRIPAGSFVMGSAMNESGRDDDEGPQRRVTITKPFYIGVTEVTQDQYAAIMGNNPSEFSGLQNPVEQVSWNDAVAFCKALSQKTGKQFRLPTEAEWEYACRAGSKTRFGFGDEDNALPAHAWFNGNSGSATHPVGQKKPNAWGLYDMHGNVWEWCSDWYTDGYTNAKTTDPQGPQSGQYRVLRGGSWSTDAGLCRSAYRFWYRPGVRLYSYGFRVASGTLD